MIDSQVIAQLEATIMARQGRREGSEIRFLCPSPSHDDHHPSASWNADKGVWFCYACQATGKTEDLATLLGIPMNGKQPDLQIKDAVYDYTDKEGRLLFQAIRFKPKRFAQRQPSKDPKKEWEWNLKGVQRVLYRLPELLAANSEALVYIAEGEKDVDQLRKLGLVATTNPQGAGKWRPEFNQYLRNRRVVILPDNDDPGRKHAEQVATHLHSIATTIKILHLQGLPDKGDVSDWLANGGTVDELQTLAANCPSWTPALSLPLESIASETFHLTDLGNAKRLVARYGENLRYCRMWDKWLIWDGKRWQIDLIGLVFRFAKQVPSILLAEAATKSDDTKRQETAVWALKSESRQRIESMIKLAETEEGIPIKPEHLDCDPWLFNVNNGTLNLRTGQLRAHHREDLITKLAPVEYVSDAQCPQWLAFLSKVMDGNERLITFLKRFTGYSLTGDTSERAISILHGHGRNGKSTFLQTMDEMLGDYSMRTPTETLLVKREGNIPNDVARLKGARFVYASEAEEGKRLAEAFIKDVTGGDKISARFMRAEFFDFLPEFKLWLGTNHKPVIRGTDRAIWDRIKLVPFKVRIPDEELIPRHKMAAMLRAELPGILSWAAEGCLEWQKEGLSEPEEVKTATQEYQTEMDTFGDFLKDCCAEVIDGRVTAKSLHAAYKQWCEDNGERVLGNKALAARLTERGFRQTRIGHKGERGWVGVALLTDPTLLTYADVNSRVDAASSSKSLYPQNSVSMRQPSACVSNPSSDDIDEGEL